MHRYAILFTAGFSVRNFVEIGEYGESGRNSTGKTTREPVFQVQLDAPAVLHCKFFCGLGCRRVPSGDMRNIAARIYGQGTNCRATVEYRAHPCGIRSGAGSLQGGNLEGKKAQRGDRAVALSER